jgi:hypothetical protein
MGFELRIPVFEPWRGHCDRLIHNVPWQLSCCWYVAADIRCASQDCRLHDCYIPHYSVVRMMCTKFVWTFMLWKAYSSVSDPLIVHHSCKRGIFTIPGVKSSGRECAAVNVCRCIKSLLYPCFRVNWPMNSVVAECECSTPSIPKPAIGHNL